MSTLHRRDIVRVLARRLSVTPKQAKAMVNELFGTMSHGGTLAEPGLLQEAVARGHEVNILGFGRFDRRERKGRAYQAEVRRKGVDGPKVWIPKRHVPYFTPNPNFSEYVRAAGELQMSLNKEGTTE